MHSRKEKLWLWDRPHVLYRSIDCPHEELCGFLLNPNLTKGFDLSLRRDGNVGGWATLGQLQNKACYLDRKGTGMSLPP
jgi:hypothetical protein